MSYDPVVRILRQVAPANRDVQLEQAGVLQDGTPESTYSGVVCAPLVELGQKLIRENLLLSELTCRPNSDGSALRLVVRVKEKRRKIDCFKQLPISILIFIAMLLFFFYFK